jgi:hypothetical protein
MSLKENKKKIKNLKKMFIKSCFNESWEVTANRYSCKYFSIVTISDKIYLKANLNPELINPIDIGIFKFYFYFLFFIVKRSSKNFIKNEKLSKLSKISDEFFDKNKELKRDNKLEEILK